MKNILIAALMAAAPAGAALAAGDVKTLTIHDSQLMSRLEPTGETASCISARSILTIAAPTETLLIFRTGTNEYYVNRVKGECHGATSNSTRLTYETSLSTVCKNQLIKVVAMQGGMLHGSCTLGSFEKMRLKPAE